MQQVADAAVRHNRKLAFVGTSMVDNAKMAQKLGYLNIPDETLVTLETALSLPPNEVVLMCTGSQGEPTSIIGRLSVGSNRQFNMVPNDTIVLSSHPIPGNEEIISKTINRLFRLGANVIYDALAPVHVSGHASQEEQKLMLSLVRPKNFIPMHGELRMLKRHAWLAEQVGVSPKNIFVIENGFVIELEDGKVHIGKRIPGKYIFVKAGAVDGAEPGLTREREREPSLNSGTFVVNLSIDKRSNRLLNNPEIITRGFVSPNVDEKMIVNAVQKRVEETVHSGVRVERDIKDVVRTFIFNKTKRRPMVSVNIVMS